MLWQSVTWEQFEWLSFPPVVASSSFSQCAATTPHSPSCSLCFPIGAVPLQCFYPSLPIPLLILLTVSPEWILHYIISYRFGPISLGAWISGPLGIPWSPLWENRGEKNKVIKGSQTKGFEASGENVFNFSPPWPVSLSFLAKFITSSPWKIHHCLSPAHLVLHWVLLFENSLACLLLFHPFHSSSCGSSSFTLELFPLLITRPPCC